MRQHAVFLALVRVLAALRATFRVPDFAADWRRAWLLGARVPVFRFAALFRAPLPPPRAPRVAGVRFCALLFTLFFFAIDNAFAGVR